MQLLKLTVHNFKNITRADLEFADKFNCLLGDNGMGKSNLLDAIHYLSVCRSFSGLTDAGLVRRDSEGFVMLEGHYSRRDALEDIATSWGSGRRKSFRRRGKDYPRLSQHIGLLPLVMVSAADMGLITGAGDERRRFLDQLVAQGDPEYRDALVRYAHLVRQRNSLLRAGGRAEVFEALETQLVAVGALLVARRRAALDSLGARVGHFYAAVAGEGRDDVGLVYQPSAPDGPALAEELGHWRERDRMMGYTTVGPHRDDFLLQLDGMAARRTASQGQAKTFTIALRLAQYEQLAQAAGLKPLLLLDDLFDKLDARRVGAIMELVASGDFGQTFITDTNRRHLDAMVEAASADASSRRIWTVDDGQFLPLETIQPS